MQFGKTISIGTSVIKCGYVVCRSTADSVTRDDLSENFVTADMVILFVVSLCCVIAVIFLLLTCGICDISNGEVSGELPVSSQQKTKAAIYYNSTPSHNTSYDISSKRPLPYPLTPNLSDNLSSSQRSQAQVAVDNNHTDSSSDFEGFN